MQNTSSPTPLGVRREFQAQSTCRPRSPRYGYVNVTDMKAMGKLAEFLSLEPDVVSKEMKAGGWWADLGFVRDGRSMMAPING